MQTDLKLDNFSGPLHLLLELIQQDDLDITDISLAQVAEQFIAYLEQLQDRAPDELADFLVVATQLLLLKSKALLPLLVPEADEDPGTLAAQLRMYKTYADAAQGIEGMLTTGNQLFARPWSATTLPVQFLPPTDLTTTDLRDLFRAVLERLEPVVRIPKAAIERVISLRDKMLQIQDLFERNLQLPFDELVGGSRDRGEVIVTFLAVLELIKQQNFIVRQEQAFSGLVVEKVDQGA